MEVPFQISLSPPSYIPLEVIIANNLGCVCTSIIYKHFYLYLTSLHFSSLKATFLPYVKFHPQSTDQFIENNPESHLKES